MTDITNKADIKLLIDAFYGKVRIDPLLGPVFASAIPQDEWQAHMEIMYSFWNTAIFSVEDYRGNPFSKHADLPIQGIHFERWISLFHATTDEFFQGEKAEEIKSRADKMGAVFQAKLDNLRSNNQFFNIV